MRGVSCDLAVRLGGCSELVPPRQEMLISAAPYREGGGWTADRPVLGWSRSRGCLSLGPSGHPQKGPGWGLHASPPGAWKRVRGEGTEDARGSHLAEATDHSCWEGAGCQGWGEAGPGAPVPDPPTPAGRRGSTRRRSPGRSQSRFYWGGRTRGRAPWAERGDAGVTGSGTGWAAPGRNETWG